MSEKQNNNKIKNVQNVHNNAKEEIPIFNSNFSTESETISRYIIEKLISFSITESLRNKVNKLLPHFCFKRIYETLDIINHIDFISYDKDDFIFKSKKHLKKMKTSKNLNNQIKIDLPEALKEMNNSEIIRKYKLDKAYDPKEPEETSIINFSKLENQEMEELDKKNQNQIVLGILIREGYKDNDNDNSFQKEEIKKEKIFERNNTKFMDNKNNVIKESNLESEKENEPFNIPPEEKIEEIKVDESHKINFNIEQNLFKSNSINFDNKKKVEIPFEKIVESKNFWDSILQPGSPPIDRDAGTKIKFERTKVIKFSKKAISKVIQDEKIKTTEQPKNNETINSEMHKKKLKRINFSNFNNNNLNRNKKKKVVELPFEWTDIEPKKLVIYKELDEIASLRELVEKNLLDKKKEKELLAKIEKEKKAKLESIEEMRKELYRKNVTVDVKGEIVYIKPIDIRNLLEEFNKGKTNFKNIKVVETEPKYNLENNEIKVEKNPDVNLKDDLKEEKNKKNRKKKVRIGGDPNSLSNMSKEIDKKKLVLEKGAKYASGSNFNIISPEIGVNITENKNVKSGGKDFYKKFNRFSIEVFQEQLSKTSNSFFPKILEENNLNYRTNESNKTDRIFSNKKIEKNNFDYKSKKNLNENKILSRNNVEKNSLSLKTKNLKIALQDLDLISDKEMNKLNKNKKIKKNLFLSNILKTEKISRNDSNDMTKFAKTLVGDERWGMWSHTEREKYNQYKIPKKPENIEIKRELPSNMLKHMPRKRLPPINTMVKLNTMTGFYTGRKTNKAKEINKESPGKKDNSETK